MLKTNKSNIIEEGASITDTEDTAWQCIALNASSDDYKELKSKLENNISFDNRGLKLHLASCISEVYNMLKAATVHILIIIMDDDNQDECWQFIGNIRTNLKENLIRIHIFTDISQEHKKDDIFNYNISDILPLSRLIDDSFITSATNSLRSYKSLSLIEKSRKQLGYKDTEADNDIINSIKDLQENSRRLGAMLDAILIPIIITSLEDDRIVFINEYAKRKFGIKSKDELLISKPDLYVNPDDYHEVLSRVINYDNIEDFETTLITRENKTFNVLQSSKFMFYKGKECKLSIFKDVTKLKELEEQLRYLATIDELTNLNNRRNFIRLASEEIVRSKRFHRELSAVMLDVDDFKKINDTYGHKTGDMVLRKLSTTLLSTLRQVDIIGRTGGEEFAILLIETDIQEAKKLTERLRQKIEEAFVITDEGNKIYYTASIGVTSLLDNDADIDALLHRADMALYQAKNNGKNQVFIDLAS